MPGPLDLSTRAAAVELAATLARGAVRPVRRFLTDDLARALEELALDALLFHRACRGLVARAALEPDARLRAAAQLAQNDVSREPRPRTRPPREQALVLAVRVHVERLARCIARTSGGDPDELAQTGLLAAAEAAARWDGSLDDFRSAGLRLARDAMRYARKKEVRLRRRDVGTWEHLTDDDLADPRAGAAALAAAVVTGELLALVPEAWGAEGQLMAIELGRALERGLGALEPEARVLVTGLYREGRELKELAKPLGMSYATAKRRHRDALVRLHRELGRAGVG